MPQEIVSAPSERLPRVQKSAKTKGYRPTCARTRLPGYRRLPVLFALRVKLSLQPNGSLRYRFVSARTRSADAVVQKDGQPALSPHRRPRAGRMMAPANRSGQTGAR